MTSALDLLKRRIAASGPVTVAEFMRIALAEQGTGYYATRDPLGGAGDFITAPEISQMFGELLGLWCVDSWERAGAPDPFLLVELGPGRGTLMADALRAAKVRRPFLSAMRLHLVEISRPLRALQEQRLGAFHPLWHDDLTTLPDGPALIVGNEFLDALPIHQFQMTERGWRERGVDLVNDTLAWTLLPPGPQLALLQAAHKRAKPDEIAEVCPAALSIASTVGARMAEEGIAALFIDYGPADSAVGESLQAVKAHRFCDPLAEIGAADLTGHVDFAAVANAAREAGARTHGALAQATFLETLGIRTRAALLSAKASEADRSAIAQAMTRLIDPRQMGSLFKALAISHPDLQELAGFP
ncbi:class I SAM-dependent methyltransferase [Dongia deserti]|uniref:class I SAM-dependent methyltransferase n=1 Tax=Dongia deserti TaxID=2268030 RepID=UPI000E650306|nr:SAM-dependent methyltransferase [Dongia deserti]